ncbi:MAG: hypothetical protein ACHQYQ_05430, partial [Bacteriovoracales bacterium]
KLKLFTIMFLLATGVAHSHPNAILGPAQSTDPSLLLASNPLLKNQLYWWCHNLVNNPGKKPQPISLEGIVRGHWSNRFKPNGEPNIAHVIDHFASETELNNDACGTVPVPPTPPTCTTNCGHISGAETFEFEIKMGGTDVNLYVCEVGFGPNFCTEGCTGGDYMVITKTNGQEITIAGPNKSALFTKGELDGSSAKVFLNSINAGASYFVRYCLNVERLIVGNPTFDPSNDIFTLNAQAHAQVPLALTGYLSTVGLNTQIFHKCGSEEELLKGSLNLEGFANLVTPGDYSVETQDFVQMSATTASCSWKILFTEANHCPRPIINEGSTFVHTELNFDLTCHESN